MVQFQVLNVWKSIAILIQFFELHQKSSISPVSHGHVVIYYKYALQYIEIGIPLVNLTLHIIQWYPVHGQYNRSKAVKRCVYLGAGKGQYGDYTA